jgi:putative membrane protein
VLRLVKFLLLLLAALAGAVVAYINPDEVVVSYYYGRLHLPLGILIFLLLGIGVLIGVFGSLMTSVGIRRENARLRRRASLAQQESHSPSSMPLQDR